MTTLAHPRPAQIDRPALSPPRAALHLATRAEIHANPAWAASFAGRRKDHRYYELIEETLQNGLDYRYLVLEDRAGNVRAIQPAFVIDQDMLAGAGPRLQRAAARLRRLFPRFMTMRTLMVGCAAGEGHLALAPHADAAWVAENLHAGLHEIARRVNAGMVVLKEFPAEYRTPLAVFSNDGYVRVPSFPMVRLGIDFKDFDDYMSQVLSHSTRKNLRRKFRKADAAEPIDLQVVGDVTPFIDEVYPLYLAVYERSAMHFEKLTKEYLCRLGRDMPDRARFLIWRQKGRAIAFALCMLSGDSLYDEYLGLDYDVALDLHLYFYTLRDIIEWGMKQGCKWYYSTALSYEPKLHLKCELVPLDLYVAHRSPWLNWFFRRIIPWLEPTRHDKVLAQFPDIAKLKGDVPDGAEPAPRHRKPRHSGAQNTRADQPDHRTPAGAS